MDVQLLLGDCSEVMAGMPDECIDLVVTSPPYDDLRNYNGYSFNFEAVANSLYRIVRPGRAVVWIVGDRTKDGDESGTSFKQALYFKSIGFNLHDTMIYNKRAVGASGSRYSYQQAFEYMFVFSKGKLLVFNPIKDLVPEDAGKIHKYPKYKSTKEGYYRESFNVKKAPSASKRKNVWTYDVGFSANNDKTGHPAVFPEQLAADHILSWSNERDTVLDPFVGSGTTGKMAVLLKRNFIGIDISSEYLEIARERINKVSTCN